MATAPAWPRVASYVAWYPVSAKLLPLATRAWAEIFGDPVAVAAMVDRLVHHAEVIALKGDSYRLKNRDLGRVPAAGTTDD